MREVVPVFLFHGQLNCLQASDEKIVLFPVAKHSEMIGNAVLWGFMDLLVLQGLIVAKVTLVFFKDIVLMQRHIHAFNREIFYSMRRRIRLRSLI